MPGDNLKLANDFATEYDKSITENNWIGPEVLYQILNPFLERYSNILDLGIGTGASSVPFKNEGHQITGIDGAEKMLEHCKAKNIAKQLILHDLEQPPFPIKQDSFQAVISNGVFHLVYPFSPIFTEVKRLLIPGGYFAFTYEKNTELENSLEIESGIWEKKTKTGVLTYKFSPDFISEQLQKNDFEIIFQTNFLAFVNKQLQKDFYFTALLARLKPNRNR